MYRAVQLLDKSGNKCFASPYWPIGSVYLSFNDTNPATFFGGTWERLTGGFLYGCVNDSGTGNGTGTKTGASSGSTGSYSGTSGSTKLTAAQSGLPAHTHTQNSHWHYVGSERDALDCPKVIGWYGSGGGAQLPHFTSGSASNNDPYYRGLKAISATATNQNNTAKAASSGHTHSIPSHTHSLNSHTHVVPYIAVFAWRRIA